MRKIALSILFCVFYASPPATAFITEINIEVRLDSIVAGLARDYDLPGVAVGIVNKKEVLYRRYYGVENVETKNPLSSRTLFRMGSVSKVMTAMAVMQLCEQGLIDLDKPVCQYVPYFQSIDQNYKEITARHLLTHTSGLPGNNKMYRGKPDFGEDAIRRYIISLGDKKFEFSPGGNHSYSNNGYVLLSALIEEVTKKSFEEYMRENILEPLGMNNSTFDFRKTDKTRLAALHVLGADFHNAVDKRERETRWMTGAGGLTSSVDDMCLFARALLNKGAGDCQKILSPENLERMWTKGENTGEKGLAWSVYSVWGGKRLVDHGGNSLGYSAELALLPDEPLAVVVLCNNRNGAEWPLAEAMLKTVLGLELKKPVFYPDYIMQIKLREEGPESALVYLKRVLEGDKKDVAVYDMLLLAYRIFQGGGEHNLETAKGILELIADSFPEDPRVHDMLGEIYFHLAVKHTRESVKKDPTNWAAKKILELLKGVNFDFYD